MEGFPTSTVPFFTIGTSDSISCITTSSVISGSMSLPVITLRLAGAMAITLPKTAFSSFFGMWEILLSLTRGSTG